MSEYPWNEKINTFTWLSLLYYPFKAVKLKARNDIKEMHEISCEL